MKVEIPVPIADLFDKISILEIKKELINDSKKNSLIQNELEVLIEVLNKKNLVNFERFASSIKFVQGFEANF